MKTNTPPPSQTHTPPLTLVVFCSAVMSSLVCVFEKAGDENHLGH